MDFFGRQDQARRGTKRLLALFALGVASIVLAVYLVVSFALQFVEESDSRAPFHPVYGRETARAPRPLFRAGVFAWVTLGTLALIGGGSIWRLSELRSGGGGIASQLGGRLVRPGTSDPDERKLLNIVEEMSIASGVPVPQVYVLPEESINAFAAGYHPGDAVVGVTRGCMRLLNREELQAVVAHEFSHILNGDMRLNLRLIALIFGIMGLALAGRVLVRVRGGRNNPAPLIGLLLILLGWLGVLFGRLIQSAVSRQREFLADAAAVQFTRNPNGLASALKKIGGLAAGSRIAAPQAAEVSHLFFANGLKRSFLTPFATHPPLEARIRAVDPAWDGQYPAPSRPAPAPPPLQPGGAATRRPPIVGRLPDILMAQAAAEAIRPLAPGPTPITLHYAAGWRAALPAEIDGAAREPLGAQAILFALLLSKDASLRERQLRALAGTAGEPSAYETGRLHAAVSRLAVRARLPLVDLALPALRGLSEPQFRRLEAALRQLIEADQQVDLFEYTLQRVVRHHLAPQFDGARRRTAQIYALKPLLPDCEAVFKLLAHLGATQPDTAAASWRAAWLNLGAPPPPLPPASADDLAAFDRALARLEQASAPVKRGILAAAAHAISADGEIKEREAEVLRALAETLDCPIPPFVTAPPD